MRTPTPGQAGSIARKAAILAAAFVAGAIPGIVFGAAEPGAAQSQPAPIILSTTTSTYDTGLLDALIPPFEAQRGVKVKIISVGSGLALALGERGEADLVLAHAPEAEEKFMAKGAGILRRGVMYNDFVLVGPAKDPAGVRRTTSVAEALAAIYGAGQSFVSRGDESGTHQLENRLWAAARIKPAQSKAYLETGQGMGATLRVASEKEAYALTDRGTFLALQGTLDLQVVSEGDAALRNVYHLMVVNPKNGPGVNVEGGRALARYLLSPEALAIVGDFGRDKFSRPLFVPDAEPYGAD